MWLRSCLKVRNRRAHVVTPKRMIDGEGYSSLRLRYPVDVSCLRQAPGGRADDLSDGRHLGTPVAPSPLKRGGGPGVL